MLDIIKSLRLKRWNYVNKIFLCVLLDICYSFLLSILVEMMSEAVKMLKGEYTIRAIKQMKMDRAIIFCRTKLDCDNMENYLNKHGGSKLHFCIKIEKIGSFKFLMYPAHLPCCVLWASVCMCM